MGDNMDNLRALDNIEKDLCSAIHSAGLAIQELSKDKPSIKQVETHSNAFLKTLQSVEANIHQQIMNLHQVSTGQAHEGSVYASQKILNMARHRHEHVRSKLVELERLRQTFLSTLPPVVPNP